jgi:hypothetical protein
MRKPVFTAITLTALISGQALANEKLTLVLDWYINPDHAPIMVAEQIGAFKAQGWTSRLSRRLTRRCRRVWWPPVRRIWLSPTSRRCTFSLMKGCRWCASVR